MTPSSLGISPVPAEAFDYRGQWVAIRDGKVVAARSRLRDLYNAPELRDTDVTYHVPASSNVAFLSSASRLVNPLRSCSTGLSPRQPAADRGLPLRGE